jgi:Leucine-rich repeat (LRR) protein
VSGHIDVGTLPSDLFEIETLEQIDLSWNFFVGTLSTSVGKLTNLSLFEGNGNDFYGTFPTEIGLLSNLENLSKSNSRLCRLTCHRREIAHLILPLKFLVFAENLFFGAIPTQLSSLPRLQGLSFSRHNKSGRKLSGGLPAFDKTPQLATLVLDGNELTGSIPSNFLSSASGARFVDLSSNLLTGTVPVGLDTISALDIRLIGNMISDLSSAFCDNSGWMEGGVGKLQSCDAIMCPPHFASADGRATAAYLCQPCPSEGELAPFYGSTSCSPIPDEREILTQFYDACNGQDWYRNDYWMSTADICDWYGVGCEDGKVVLINLAANHVTGSPNEGLFDLPNLRVLWLSSNNIDFSFKNIGSAQNLMELQLDQIGLKSVEGLEAAKGLVSLDLSFNMLQGNFPEELFLLENMRVLNLRSNSLSGPLPPSFTDQRFLRHLRLDENDFWGYLPSYSDSTVLWNLYLGSNSIDGAIPNNFLGGVPSRAKVLVDLAGNELSGTVPSSLGRLDDLTIYLRENQFTGLAKALCEKTAWMDGEVGRFGCDAILCANGTSNFIGRESAEAGKCVKCPRAERGWFGETLCPGPNYSSAGFSVGYNLLGLLLGIGIPLMSLM